MSKKPDKVVEPRGLQDISNLFLTASSSLPVSANVFMKLPVFWPDAAEVWLVQANSQFAICSVTVSKTKFYHSVAVLPQEVASQILDLILAPPDGVLRGRLIML